MAERLGPEGRWVVESLAVGGELQPPLGDRPLTLEIRDERVSGSTGVSQFTGRLGGDSLFEHLAVAGTAGPHEHESLAQEEIYLRHLRAADTFEESSEGISLVADGLITVTLTPAPSTSARGDECDTL